MALRFRLRTLCILLTVAAVGLAWFGSGYRRRARAQQTLHRLGAEVFWDEGFADLYLPRSTTDADLQDIVGVGNVRTLVLDETQVSDAGLASLAECQALRFLAIRRTSISGKGLQSLRGMKELEDLWLDGTLVGEEFSEVLATLTSLQDLSLAGTKVGNSIAAAISELRSLEELNLGNTQVTDRGVAHICTVRSLRKLTLSMTDVTGASVPSLVEHPSFELHLEYSLMTPADVAAVARVHPSTSPGVSKDDQGELRFHLPLHSRRPFPQFYATD